MAYESVEDANQQTLETLTELERRARDLVNILKGGIDVGQSGTLGDLSLLDTLSASPVGNAATLRNNMGLASGATTTVGTAATRNVGTGSGDLPNTAQADARYARLSGANNFDTMPTVNNQPIVESDSNSLGVWERTADGRQHCYGISSLQTADDVYRWDFPMAFSTTPRMFVSWLISANYDPGTRVAAQRPKSAYTDVIIRVPSGTEGWVEMHAAGPWGN